MIETTETKEAADVGGSRIERVVSRDSIIGVMRSCPHEMSTWLIRLRLGQQDATSTRKELQAMERDGIVKRHIFSRPGCTVWELCG